MTESQQPQDHSQPGRVLFFGVTGTGKSSAAHRYAQARGLPEYSVDDDIGWLPGWQQRELEDERAIAATIAAQDRWVLDSIYSRWSDIILPRTQLIVALDFPRWVSLSRLVRRSVRRIVTKEPICNGNTESAHELLFSGKSIILWHFQSFPGKRRSIRSFRHDPGMPPVMVFRHPRQLAKWFAELEGAEDCSIGRNS